MSDLEAGHELNALIAERVMGWHIEEWTSYWPNIDRVWCNADGACMASVGEWAPSTEWGAAGRVITHMQQNGWVLQLDNARNWAGKFTRGRAMFSVFDVATAPLAICRAALLALDVTEP